MDTELSLTTRLKDGGKRPKEEEEEGGRATMRGGGMERKIGEEERSGSSLQTTATQAGQTLLPTTAGLRVQIPQRDVAPHSY